MQETDNKGVGIKSISKITDYVFKGLRLFVRGIATHSVKFMLTYTIPFLMAFAIVYGRETIISTEETNCLKKQQIIDNQRRQIKILKDSIKALHSDTTHKVTKK